MKLQDAIETLNSSYDKLIAEGSQPEYAVKAAIALTAAIFDATPRGLHLSNQDAMGLALSISVLVQKCQPDSNEDPVLQLALGTVGKFYVEVNKIALATSGE